MSETLCWQTNTTPQELRSMLTTLGNRYPIVKGSGNGLSLAFQKIDEPGICRIYRNMRSVDIAYSTPAQAGRALGTLMSGLARDGETIEESTRFKMFGVMIDCSRNAVMTVEHLKEWMDQLTLLGYNMLMLYTEDTYELPGEPYFGYQRGAYTAKELKEIDSYAAKLNIELIPCIQTLGHLEQILKHPAYWPIKDVRTVLLVGEEKTYELIEKMIAHWRKVSRASRIHIGMDETHDLGRGRYLDKNGYRHGFEIFNEHLGKIVELCKKYDFEPMIWSDMYFRLGSATGQYYDRDTVIPQEVVEKIPAEAELVYWDYYHRDKQFYLDWIERHRNMGKNPLVGSGVWTWDRYWYDRRTTEPNAGACIDACLEADIDQIFFTQWGDKGAFCDHDSAFAGMVWCSDKAYRMEHPTPEDLEKRFGTICGGSYAAHILASDIEFGVENLHPNLWDDPFYETYFRTWAKDDAEKMIRVGKGYAQLAKKLSKHVSDKDTGNLLHAHNLADVFAKRYEFSGQLLKAYKKKDKDALRRLRRKVMGIIESVEKVGDSLREMWLSHNKPEGLEVLQGRLGMLVARYKEISTRLGEYLRGDIDKIAELEHSCPPK